MWIDLKYKIFKHSQKVDVFFRIHSSFFILRYKILFISSWFPNRIELTNGNFVQQHAESVALKHDVQILHVIGDFELKEQYHFDENIINGIKTLIVYYKNTQFPPLNFFRRFQAYRKGFSKMQKPDLIHANIMHNSMLFAVWLKKRFNIPFVISEHWSLFLKVNKGKLSFIKLKIAQYIAQKSNYIFPVSGVLAANLKELGFKNKFEIIGNVVNTNVFYPKEKQNLPFIFLHISNLVKLKKANEIVETAIELRKINQQFELHIGGDGEVLPLQEIIKKANAESFIKTFGTQTQSQVAERMRNSNAFILFSDYETLSCVLMESIASGTPVISTNVGAIAEFVNESNGILINKNKEELLATMQKMMKIHQEFSPLEMHEAIKSQFSKEIIAEKFSKMYKKVLQR